MSFGAVQQPAAVLTFLCRPVHDELTRPTFRMADRIGHRQFAGKVDLVNRWVVGRLSMPARKRAQVILDVTSGIGPNRKRRVTRPNAKGPKAGQPVDLLRETRARASLLACAVIVKPSGSGLTTCASAASDSLAHASTLRSAARHRRVAVYGAQL